MKEAHGLGIGWDGLDRGSSGSDTPLWMGRDLSLVMRELSDCGETRSELEFLETKFDSGF